MKIKTLHHHHKQKGIALPVALIMFVVMLISSIYLSKAATSSSIMISNLAYQRSLSRTSDLGLITAYDWLITTHAGAATISKLDADSLPDGYISSFSFSEPQVNIGDAAFWDGSKKIDNIDGNGNNVEYIIYRMCSLKMVFSAAANHCITSNFEPATASGMASGASLSTGNEEAMINVPLMHYLITARVINTRKGTTSINQLNVMMGV